MKFSKIFTFFIALILIPLALAQSVDVKEDSIELTINQNQIKTFDINIENKGTINISLEFSHNIDLEDNEGDKITLTFPESLEIEPGQTQTTTITVETDPNMDFANYAGTVTVTDTNTNEEDSFDLSIQVQPNICDFGEFGNDLEITIKDPEEGEEYSPGDTIKIKVEVENNGQNSIRTQLEAFLFNEFNNIADIASETIKIDENEDEKFTIELEIPTNNNDLDDGDELTIYIKAFDDDNEQLNCVQESIAIDINLEKYDIIIKEEKTLFFPSMLTCGETAYLNVGLINVGDKDADVEVSIENNALNIFEKSNKFEIEDFSSDENEALKKFDIFIPEDIQPGEYMFTIEAKYSGKTKTHSLPLDILSCTEFEIEQQFFQAPKVEISVIDKTLSLAPSDTELIHTKITNNLPLQKILFVSLKDVSDFAQEATKTITLEPFKTTSIFLPLNINNADPGKYTAIIEVSDGSSILASETLTINILSSEEQTQGISNFISEIPLYTWIIINLVIIALFLMALRVMQKRF